MTTSLLSIFAQTVLPVFLVAGAGATLAQFYALDHRSLGRTVFYLGTPMLIFRSLYTTQFEWATLQRLAGVAMLVMLCTGILSWLISTGLERRERAAIVLTSAMSNNGNMGMPLCLFAFGEVGLALATIYYVTTSFVGNTLGVVVASAGRMSITKSLIQALRTPMLYAAILGLLCNLLRLHIPVTLERAIELLANMAIPLMLIILGVQLRATFKFHNPALILRSVTVRLIAGPLVAWGICYLLGIDALEQNVMVVQAAMPTAVITSVVATEYDAAPELVATDIFVSTLLSMITLSVILWWIL